MRDDLFKKERGIMFNFGFDEIFAIMYMILILCAIFTVSMLSKICRRHSLKMILVVVAFVIGFVAGFYSGVNGNFEYKDNKNTTIESDTPVAGDYINTIKNELFK